MAIPVGYSYLDGFYWGPDGTGPFVWDGTSMTLIGGIAGSVYATSYGGYWDGVGDDTPALNAAMAAAGSYTRPRAVLLPPRVLVSGPVYVPTGVYVFGYNYWPGNVGTFLTCTAGYASPTGFCFNFNTTDGINPASNVYFRPKISVLAGIYVANLNNVGGFRLMCGFGSTMVMDIYAAGINQVIVKPAAQYTDNWEIRRINVASVYDNSEYCIDLVGTGDAVLIDELNFPVPAPANAVKAVSITDSRGSTISNLVNGILSFVRCVAANIVNYHSEIGSILAADSSIHVKDSFFALKNGATYYPIKATSSFTKSYTLQLTDVEFDFGLGTFTGGPGAEVQVWDQINLVSINARRVSMIAGDESCTTGIRVANSAGTVIAAWSQNSWYLSTNGSMNQQLPLGQITTTVATGFIGVYGPFTTGVTASTLVNGTTYYYVAQRLIDAPNLLGRVASTAEISIAPSAANQAIGMTLEYGAANSGSCIVRLYRGTASGSYNNYVDLPMIRGGTLLDLGGSVAGWAWTARGAGPVDTLNTALGEYLVTPGKGAQGLIPFETIVGDADSAIGGGGYLNSTYIWNSPLTAARTATIAALATRIGTRVRVVRTAAATGAFNLNVNNPAAVLLKALAAAGTWAEFELCSDSVWRITANGSL